MNTSAMWRRRIIGSAAGLALAVSALGLASPATAQAATPVASTAKAKSATSPGGAAVVPSEATDQQRVKVYTTPADLTDEQRANANTIIKVAEDSDQIDPAGLDNVIHSALMAAMQESSLINLDYGDRDSVGLFQQRPSAGWGTVAQIMDPVFASKSFYGINPAVSPLGAIQQGGWQSMDPGVLAQKVQVSAYPDAYAKWHDLAVQLLNNHRGGSSQTNFATWGSGINVRADASLSSAVVASLSGPTAVYVQCQKQGDTVTAEGYTNNWWAKLRDQGGYISNIYINDPNAKLPNVPLC